MSDLDGARTELQAAREQVVQAMALLRNCSCSVESAMRRGAPSNELDALDHDVNEALSKLVDVLCSVQFTLDLPPERWEATDLS